MFIIIRVYKYMYILCVHVLCCFALFVCLTLLASFFLPSHLSFNNMHVYVYICVCVLLGEDVLREPASVCGEVVAGSVS